MIICNICKLDKDLEDFDNHKNGKYGKRTTCKKCQAIRATEYRQKNKDFVAKIKVNYRNSFDGFIQTSLGECRRRSKYNNKEFNLDSEFLSSLWQSQNGLCKFTGQPLEYTKAPKIKNPFQASLDRIDSSKGYTKDNVRWVCWFINQMKMDYSEEEFIKLIKTANQKL